MSNEQPHGFVWDGQPDHEPANGQVWIDPVGDCFVGPRRAGEHSRTTFGPRRCYDARPAPAGGMGVEERLVILELDLKGLAKFTERRLLALESQPVLSVPRLHDLIENARGHTMTPEEHEAQRQSFARGNVAIDQEGRTTVASPQRTPAEVEGGESVGMKIVLQWIGSERFAKLTDTSSEHWLIEAIDLSTAPRGKVPSREELVGVCFGKFNDLSIPSIREINHYVAEVCADAILALFTEGNARG